MTHSTTWTAKDPDAVQDYLFTIPLDEGDSVASATFDKLSGDVVIDNDPEGERTAEDIIAWLSGGTTGTTSVFRIAWVTTDGREDDAVVTLAVIEHSESHPLELTGYAKPSVAHFITRYPTFEDVEPTTVQLWLTDAERYVDTSWMEGDYAAALMAMAAHNLAISGLGAEAAQTADLPPGITGMKIGTLGLTFDSALTRDKATGSLSSTRYGSYYLSLLRRNKAGPRVAPTGSVLAADLRYPMGSW
jgi:hypothetical protein